jgi:hypothetical protein
VLIEKREFKEILPEEIKIKDFIRERKIPIWRGSPGELATIRH